MFGSIDVYVNKVIAAILSLKLESKNAATAIKNYKEVLWEMSKRD